MDGSHRKDHQKLQLTNIRTGAGRLKCAAVQQLADHSGIPHLTCPGYSLQGTHCASLRTVRVPAALDFFSAFFFGPLNTPAVGANPSADNENQRCNPRPVAGKLPCNHCLLLHFHSN